MVKSLPLKVTIVCNKEFENGQEFDEGGKNTQGIEKLKGKDLAINELTSLPYVVSLALLHNFLVKKIDNAFK